MSVEQQNSPVDLREVMKWRHHDTVWMFNLFGTAVGAGILFLPINAGMNGFWPVLFMCAMAFPMSYFAHLGLSRFVMSSARPGSDLPKVVEEHFGKSAGFIITLLYFMAIYPFVLVYGVGITNAINSFLVNQLGMDPLPRLLLSGVLVFGMTVVIWLGEELMLKVCEALVYPMVAVLLFVALYLIPEWNLSSLQYIPDAGQFSMTMWLSIPVLIFAFSHTPAISYFTVAQEREHGVHAEPKARQILARASAMLVLFTMGFVVSCVLALTPQDMALAKEQNVPILSYIANQRGGSFIAYLGPLVATLAIVTSYFGHFIGAREGLHGVIAKLMRAQGTAPEPVTRKIGLFTNLFLVVTTWLVAAYNPSVLGIIESLGGPVVAAILFIMPMIAIRTVPAMRKYAGRPSNVFITLVGWIGLSAILYGLFRMF